MKTPTVELVCHSCGLTAEMPLSPAEMRTPRCEGCGREMLFLLDDAGEEPVELEPIPA